MLPIPHRSVLASFVVTVTLCGGLIGCSGADDASAQKTYDDIIKEHEVMLSIMNDIKSVEDIDNALKRLDEVKDRLVALATKAKDMKITQTLKTKLEADHEAFMKTYEQKLMPHMMRIMSEERLRDAFTERVMPKLTEFETAVQNAAR